jgi:hypothetical protein
LTDTAPDEPAQRSIFTPPVGFRLVLHWIARRHGDFAIVAMVLLTAGAIEESTSPGVALCESAQRRSA